MKYRIEHLVRAISLGICVVLGAGSAAADPKSESVTSSAGGSLESGFTNPPDSARPHCYWTWMNGNDLGEVAVIAEVRLNGKNLGVLWHPPFRVEISKALRPSRSGRQK